MSSHYTLFLKMLIIVFQRLKLSLIAYCLTEVTLIIHAKCHEAYKKGGQDLQVAQNRNFHSVTETQSLQFSTILTYKAHVQLTLHIKLGQMKVFSHFCIPLIICDRDKASFLYTFSVIHTILQKTSALEDGWMDGQKSTNSDHMTDRKSLHTVT